MIKNTKSEFTVVFESYQLLSVEIAKSKLASEGIESYIKNEFVNNVAIATISQGYQLLVDTQLAEKAIKILNEASENL